MDVRLARRALLLIIAAMIIIASMLLMRSALSYPNVSLKDHLLVGIWKTAYFFEPSSRDLKHVSKLHEKPEDLTQPQCIACHGYMEEYRKTPGNSTIRANVHFHLFMTNANYSCVTCHKTKLVFSVPAIGQKKIYLGRVKRGLYEYDTETLPGSVLNTNIQLCLNCHNGMGQTSLLWPKPHLEDGWSIRHGVVSYVSKAKKTCSKCHDKKNFCTACHRENKPSTHLDKDQWRRNHKSSYKERPVGCKACHTSDFCNSRCHGTNHEQNWRNIHEQRVVKYHGSDFCLNCHYYRFCNSCHMNPDMGFEMLGDYTQDNPDRDEKRPILNNQVKNELDWIIPKPSARKAQFNYPHDIDVDKDGNVYVTDTYNNCIQKFDSDGKFIKKWGSESPPELLFPDNIAINKKGNIIVVNSAANYGERSFTQEFNSEGKLIGLPDAEDSVDNEAKLANGLSMANLDCYRYNAVDEDGNRYILNLNSVRKFNTNGKLIQTWNGKEFQFCSPLIETGGPVSDKLVFGRDGIPYVQDWKGQFIQRLEKNGKITIVVRGDGAGEYNLDWPISVAVDKNGYIYIAEKLNDRIKKLDAKGKLISKWGSEVYSDGQLDLPHASVIDKDGNVYVADTGNDRIQKFDSNGRFLAKWGSRGTGNGEFQNPEGISVDSNGFIYVADSGNNRIQKFSSEGKFIAKWGQLGAWDREKPKPNGLFDYPRGIAIDKDNNIYVVDSRNNRIQKFTSSGEFITKWGRYGTNDGQLRFAEGIAITPNGNIYVADKDNHRIDEFTKDGKFVATWGENGTKTNQFNNPCGVALDNNGNIYIADTGNNRVQKYKLP